MGLAKRLIERRLERQVWNRSSVWVDLGYAREAEYDRLLRLIDRPADPCPQAELAFHRAIDDDDATRPEP